jgi:hypothetical protein
MPPSCRILPEPGLLSSLLSYPHPEVQRAVLATLLLRIRAEDLPRDPRELQAWVSRNGEHLRWDADQGVFILRPGR